MYRPSEAAQMTTAIQLQQPIKTKSSGVSQKSSGVSQKSYGVSQKSYKDVDGIVMANFKTYGGTEKTDNGILSIEETAQIVCRYRPDIKSDTRVVLLQTGAIYEILGEPENIEMRNMFLKFKIRRIKGGV
jgi:head-tail adaptor